MEIYVESGCRASLSQAGLLPYTRVGPLPRTCVGDALVRELRTRKHVSIPDGTKEIGSHWFYASAIESVYIPASVETIGA